LLAEVAQPLALVPFLTMDVMRRLFQLTAKSAMRCPPHEGAVVISMHEVDAFRLGYKPGDWDFRYPRAERHA
jgi:hypothetical protein